MQIGTFSYFASLRKSKLEHFLSTAYIYLYPQSRRTDSASFALSANFANFANFKLSAFFA
jgi:hypothetical protein